MSSLLTREHRDVWKAAGSKDMAQRVQEKAVGLVETHETVPLSDETVAALDRLKRRGERELTEAQA